MAIDTVKLAALAIKNAQAGKHFDGGGLFLDVHEVADEKSAAFAALFRVHEASIHQLIGGCTGPKVGAERT